MKTENSLPIKVLADMSNYKGKAFVIKYGGSIMKNAEAQQAFIEDISILLGFGVNLVIVHGGGPEITRWLEKAGVENKFINGLRVTDESTMEIVEMVLSGSVNKKLTSALNRKAISAVGISGRDNKLIQAKKKYLQHDGQKIDIGFVGEVTEINKNFLEALLDKHLLPVISPIGCDEEGHTYNINADYAAGAVAAALKAEKLIIMTDIEGVYKDITDKASLISSITVAQIKQYISEGIISGGMIPKMECCVDAVTKGTKNVHLIDGRKDHSLILDTFSKSCGTKIYE